VRTSPSTAAVPPSDLPSYLIPSGSDGSASAVIFYDGFDVTKEILYGIIGDQFSRRGIACLIIDTPATGEPLRLRGVPSRPDYEVPTAAIVDIPAEGLSSPPVGQRRYAPSCRRKRSGQCRQDCRRS
jgi:hypothetical protein